MYFVTAKKLAREFHQVHKSCANVLTKCQIPISVKLYFSASTHYCTFLFLIDLISNLTYFCATFSDTINHIQFQ